MCNIIEPPYPEKLLEAAYLITSSCSQIINDVPVTLWVNACQCCHYICLRFGMFWITLRTKMQLFFFSARQDVNGFAIFNNVLTWIVCKKQRNVPTHGVSSLQWGQFYGLLYFFEMQCENVRILFLLFKCCLISGLTPVSVAFSWESQMTPAGRCPALQENITM